MIIMREVIGEKLRAERIRQNRSLRVVAKDSYMSLGYLSEIERGQKEMSSEILNQLCKGLSLPVSDLLVEVLEEVIKREKQHEKA
jgi:transcriptional regulator with XRE-family HTH domain